MPAIDTCVVLAAGAGTRLRDAAESKPLCRVGGKPLIDHAIERLARVGIARVIVTTGYRAEDVEAHLAARQWPVIVETARTEDWRQPNGVSALAAAPLLGGDETLLVMCDHLVDPALYGRMAEAGAGPGLRLGIDRRLGHAWIDALDVTCVATDLQRGRGEQIVAIGKELTPHDCYDTGVFAVGPAFFAALRKLEAPSITEAVRVLIRQHAALAVDCSDLDWIDVDDAKALAAATAWALVA